MMMKFKRLTEQKRSELFMYRITSLFFIPLLALLSISCASPSLKLEGQTDQTSDLSSVDPNNAESSSNDEEGNKRFEDKDHKGPHSSDDDGNRGNKGPHSSDDDGNRGNKGNKGPHSSDDDDSDLLSDDEIEKCHNDRKMVFCHRPPGQESKSIEQCLPEQAIENKLRVNARSYRGVCHN
jgi:hypothetical protein